MIKIMFSRFDNNTVTGMWQADRQTEDKQNSYINIARQQCCSDARQKFSWTASCYMHKTIMVKRTIHCWILSMRLPISGVQGFRAPDGCQLFMALICCMLPWFCCCAEPDIICFHLSPPGTGAVVVDVVSSGCRTHVTSAALQTSDGGHGRTCGTPDSSHWT